MGDLTDEELAKLWHVGHEGCVCAECRLAVEVRRHRAATKGLNPDEVAQLRHRLKDWRVTAETSAALVERLLDGATVAPVLSTEERRVLGNLRDSDGRTTARERATIDRLLGASR